MLKLLEHFPALALLGPRQCGKTTLAFEIQANWPKSSRYLDLFEHTFVIRRLPPYFKNVGKRLTKRPKIYLRDSGLLHQLLNIGNMDTLHGHPCRGASWEGFVIEQIIALLPDWQPYFYRTANGAELDLLMLRGDEILAFEIKASVAPKLTKGFHTARQDVQPHKIFLVSRSDDTWTTADGLIHTHLRALPELLAAHAGMPYFLR